jgi:hypothetical protein
MLLPEVGPTLTAMSRPIRAVVRHGDKPSNWLTHLLVDVTTVPACPTKLLSQSLTAERRLHSRIGVYFVHHV